MHAGATMSKTRVKLKGRFAIKIFIAGESHADPSSESRRENFYLLWWTFSIFYFITNKNKVDIYNRRHVELYFLNWTCMFFRDIFCFQRLYFQTLYFQKLNYSLGQNVLQFVKNIFDFADCAMRRRLKRWIIVAVEQASTVNRLQKIVDLLVAGETMDSEPKNMKKIVSE